MNPKYKVVVTTDIEEQLKKRYPTRSGMEAYVSQTTKDRFSTDNSQFAQNVHYN